MRRRNKSWTKSLARRGRGRLHTTLALLVMRICSQLSNTLCGNVLARLETSRAAMTGLLQARKSAGSVNYLMQDSLMILTKLLGDTAPLSGFGGPV
jgi:DNA phosphorothioation-dependent restriction protein DptG